MKLGCSDASFGSFFHGPFGGGYEEGDVNESADLGRGTGGRQVSFMFMLSDLIYKSCGCRSFIRLQPGRLRAVWRPLPMTSPT